ncbi:2-hydroxycarboxylate transporter family protein [Clostridium sp. CF011]|uniref:2-hydroxycarboxylate transporter family protein n=1 Tax=Clostridium sp. CF011 TaxID=2843318 RepID=UPI001C0D21ED|nr:2-hydroxycarboxylate transporter family protein [Clostridium sp. CF011]MBU3090524.1 2-hydroxycarboxylate transporter family protein [Clostridium sp. CF011]WAG69885.1 2-hydroxycarboxylate transporter family protein [Clostridium sp. CF011]
MLAEKRVSMLNEKKTPEIMGIKVQYFAIITMVMFVGAYMDVLPPGIVSVLPLMLVIGTVLYLIGDNLPIVKDYFGGGAIVVIFGSSALATYKILPEGVITSATAFMTSGGFLDLFICGLIAGSLLGINRKLLLQAVVRYLPCLLGGIIAALGLVGLFGIILGYGAKEAIFYIGIPIMGGGMGAGAVPLAKIFGATLNQDPKIIMSIMTPAVALGNAFAIVAAGILNKIGKVKPSLTGNGELIIPNSKTKLDAENEVEDKSNDLELYAIGILLSGAFLTAGYIVGKFLPTIHAYAWMILIVILVKMTGALPAKCEYACSVWYSFVMKNFTVVVLVGVGIAYTDLNAVISALTFKYIILVGITIIGAVIGSGVVARYVGFYPVETSISAGLCMANMGGSGDVAVLTAAKRMKLMPFAAISSRLGGALILIIASVLLRLF